MLNVQELARFQSSFPFFLIPQGCWRSPSGDFLIKTFILLSCGSGIFPPLWSYVNPTAGERSGMGLPRSFFIWQRWPAPAWQSLLLQKMRGRTATWGPGWPSEQSPNHPALPCVPAVLVHAAEERHLCHRLPSPVLSPFIHRFTWQLCQFPVQPRAKVASPLWTAITLGEREDL